MVLATIALGAVASTGLLAPTNSVTSATSVVATQPQPQQHHASPPPVPTVKELSAAARVYIIDIAPIFGNISAFEILARLAARGLPLATSRDIGRVYHAPGGPQDRRLFLPSMMRLRDPSCCSARTSTKRSSSLSYARPHITNDPTAADFLPCLPATPTTSTCATLASTMPRL